jgi:hypothetical protein
LSVIIPDYTNDVGQEGISEFELMSKIYLAGQAVLGTQNCLLQCKDVWGMAVYADDEEPFADPFFQPWNIFACQLYLSCQQSHLPSATNVKEEDASTFRRVLAAAKREHAQVGCEETGHAGASTIGTAIDTTITLNTTLGEVISSTIGTSLAAMETVAGSIISFVPFAPNPLQEYSVGGVSNYAINDAVESYETTRREPPQLRGKYTFLNPLQPSLAPDGDHSDRETNLVVDPEAFHSIDYTADESGNADDDPSTVLNALRAQYYQQKDLLQPQNYNEYEGSVIGSTVGSTVEVVGLLGSTAVQFVVSPLGISLISDRDASTRSNVIDDPRPAGETVDTETDVDRDARLDEILRQMEQDHLRQAEQRKSTQLEMANHQLNGVRKKVMPECAGLTGSDVPSVSVYVVDSPAEQQESGHDAELSLHGGKDYLVHFFPRSTPALMKNDETEAAKLVALEEQRMLALAGYNEATHFISYSRSLNQKVHLVNDIASVNVPGESEVDKATRWAMLQLSLEENDAKYAQRQQQQRDNAVAVYELKRGMESKRALVGPIDAAGATVIPSDLSAVRAEEQNLLEQISARSAELLLVRNKLQLVRDSVQKTSLELAEFEKVVLTGPKQLRDLENDMELKRQHLTEKVLHLAATCNVESDGNNGVKALVTGGSSSSRASSVRSDLQDIQRKKQLMSTSLERLLKLEMDADEQLLRIEQEHNEYIKDLEAKQETYRGQLDDDTEIKIEDLKRVYDLRRQELDNLRTALRDKEADLNLKEVENNRGIEAVTSVIADIKAELSALGNQEDGHGVHVSPDRLEGGIPS